MGTDTIKIKIELKDWLIAYHGHFAIHSNLHKECFRDELVDAWTSCCKAFNADVDSPQYIDALLLLYDHVHRNPRNPFKSFEAFSKFIRQHQSESSEAVTAPKKQNAWCEFSLNRESAAPQIYVRSDPAVW